MTVDDELVAAESVVQVSRENAAQHLERLAGVMRLNETIIDQYRTYLDTATSVAQSTLELCRTMVSTRVRVDASASDDTTRAVQGFIAGVLRSMEAMYLAMSLVECLAPRAEAHDSHGRTPDTQSSATRGCSFCGMPYQQGKVVAGPTGNICASCTRLACRVLGIALQE